MSPSIDLTTSRLGRSSPAELVGSGPPGLQPPRRNHLPKYPSIPEMVLEPENEKYLHALLPVLEKHKCLEFDPLRKSRRSPWVRAFCELHHPATGAWGQFSNAPAIDSTHRYRFKSYKIPKTLQCLRNKYNGSHPQHKALQQALEKYYECEEYFKQGMAVASEYYAIQVKKPSEQRAAIPMIVGEQTAPFFVTIEQGPPARNNRRHDAAETAATAISPSRSQSLDANNRGNGAFDSTPALDSDKQGENEQHVEASSPKDSSEQEKRTIDDVEDASADARPVLRRTTRAAAQQKEDKSHEASFPGTRRRITRSSQKKSTQVAQSPEPLMNSSTRKRHSASTPSSGVKLQKVNSRKRSKTTRGILSEEKEIKTKEEDNPVEQSRLLGVLVASKQDSNDNEHAKTTEERRIKTEEGDEQTPGFPNNQASPSVKRNKPQAAVTPTSTPSLDELQAKRSKLQELLDRRQKSLAKSAAGGGGDPFSAKIQEKIDALDMQQMKLIMDE